MIKLKEQQSNQAESLAEGLLKGDRRSLARSITLIESTLQEDRPAARLLLQKILPYTGNSIRIGISGVPGAGKSTFIESFGTAWTSSGERIAVLAVDPSSSVSGGSILGDKTRMQRLIENTNVFIRPTPSGGSLGGVARRTRETILLCEAAGYKAVMIETVGVGQSEIDVASMCDFYMLIMLPNAGDELQGIKKGILELADLLVVNKCDTDETGARRTQAELTTTMHFMQPRTPQWEIPVLLASAINDIGMDRVLKSVESFRQATQASSTGGLFHLRRKEQNRNWMWQLAKEELIRSFLDDPAVQAESARIESDVFNGRLPASSGAERLLVLFRN